MPKGVVYLCVILAVLVVPCLVQADLLDFKAEPAACGWKSAETDYMSGSAIMVIAAHALPVLHKPVPEPDGLLLTALMASVVFDRSFPFRRHDSSGF